MFHPIPTRFLRRLEDVYSLQGERLKAQVLQQGTLSRTLRRRRVRKTLVLDTSLLVITQEQHT
jgi:hypothetical protein